MLTKIERSNSKTQIVTNHQQFSICLVEVRRQYQVIGQYRKQVQHHPIVTEFKGKQRDYRESQFAREMLLQFELRCA